MQPQGKAEVRDAVAIALLTVLGTALINAGVETLKVAWADRQKKRRKAKKKASRTDADPADPSPPNPEGQPRSCGEPV